MEKKINNRSLERALQILCSFSNEKRELSLTQLSTSLNLPKPTVYRLCSTLVSYDFLKYNKDTNIFSLGLRLFELGGIVFSTFSVRDISSPHLTRLQKNTGESILLGVLQEGYMIKIDFREDERSSVRFSTEIGIRKKPYFGMLGQTLLAFLPEKQLNRVLDKNPIEQITKKSIKTREELDLRLEKIRKRGYVFEREETIDGVGGIAAPIRDHTGNVVAAVGLRFILSSEALRKRNDFVMNVCKTADEISADLGYNNRK